MRGPCSLWQWHTRGTKFWFSCRHPGVAHAGRLNVSLFGSYQRVWMGYRPTYQESGQWPKHYGEAGFDHSFYRESGKILHIRESGKPVISGRIFHTFIKASVLPGKECSILPWFIGTGIRVKSWGGFGLNIFGIWIRGTPCISSYHCLRYQTVKRHGPFKLVF